MESLLSPELISSLGTLVATVVGLAGAFLGKKLNTLLGHKAEEAKSRLAADAYHNANWLLEDLTKTATGFVQKTIVEKAKGNNTWDTAAKTAAKVTALDMVNNLLGSAGIKKVQEAYGLKAEEVQKLLSAKIEQSLVVSK